METHVDVLAPSRAQRVLNQRRSPLVILKDLNACLTRLGRNETKNGTNKQASLTPSPAVMYSASEVDSDTTCCVLLAWLTSVPPNVTAIPDTERLSLTLSVA